MMTLDRELVRQRYAAKFGADIEPAFFEFVAHRGMSGSVAVLGYVRAGTAPLFLERYLDDPIERMVGNAFGCDVARDRIVELGNLAACSGWALVELWGKAANDLGGESEYAVATLTAPLRAMFRRIGLPLKVLAQASANRSGDSRWGSYYESDPQVCVGRIAEGQQAIANFLAHRRKGEAA